MTGGLCSTVYVGSDRLRSLIRVTSFYVLECCILFDLPLRVGKRRQSPCVSFQADLSVVIPLLVLESSDTPVEFGDRIHPGYGD